MAAQGEQNVSIPHFRSDDDYDAFVKANEGRKILIDFTADWCGPCQMMAPYFQEFANKFRDILFIKVDVDGCDNTPSVFGVNAMPTFVAITAEADGKYQEVDRLQGASLPQLEKLIMSLKPATAQTENQNEAETEDAQKAKDTQTEAGKEPEKGTEKEKEKETEETEAQAKEQNVSIPHFRSDDDYDAFVKANEGRKVVIDFTADWCGPCQMMAPFLQEFANNFRDILFIKVDVDGCDNTPSVFGVNAMPTFVAVIAEADGKHKEVDRLQGASPPALKKLIMSLNPAEAQNETDTQPQAEAQAEPQTEPQDEPEAGKEQEKGTEVEKGKEQETQKQTEEPKKKDKCVIM